MSVEEVKMDALEFLRERKRMCNLHKDCEGCPLEGTKCVVSSIVPDEDYKRIIATVEQWAKEHPRKTRQSVFLEQWPEANIDDLGVLKVCPSPISTSHRSAHGGCAYIGGECSDCRRDFWMQEVE